MLMGLKLAATLGTQLICALIISQYSASHSGHGKERIAEFLGLCIRAYWSVSPLFFIFCEVSQSNFFNTVTTSHRPILSPQISR